MILPYISFLLTILVAGPSTVHAQADTALRKTGISTARETDMRYRIQEGTFDIPTDWMDFTTNEFQGPREDGFNLTIARNDKVKEKTPADVTQDIKAKLGAMFESFEVAKEETTTVAGCPANSVEFRAVFRGESYSGVIVVVFHGPHRALRLQALSPDSVWPNYVGQVRKIISSFEMVKHNE